MGVRVYNPVTGTFTSTDPIPGGNTTAYAYPQDPANQQDLDGRWGGWLKKKVKKAWKATGKASKWLTDSKWGKRIQKGCRYAWGQIGTACGAVYSAAYARQGRWKKAASTLASSVVGGAVAKGFTRGYRNANKAAYLRKFRQSRGHRFYRAATYTSANLHGWAAGKAVDHRRKRRKS